MAFFYRLRNACSECKWHFQHWLIIFKCYPDQFPATKGMTELESALWHKEAFYDYLSFGIETGWEPLLSLEGKELKWWEC